MTFYAVSRSFHRRAARRRVGWAACALARSARPRSRSRSRPPAAPAPPDRLRAAPPVEQEREVELTPAMRRAIDATLDAFVAGRGRPARPGRGLAARRARDCEPGRRSATGGPAPCRCSRSRSPARASTAGAPSRRHATASRSTSCSTRARRRGAGRSRSRSTSCATTSAGSSTPSTRRPSSTRPEEQPWVVGAARLRRRRRHRGGNVRAAEVRARAGSTRPGSCSRSACSARRRSSWAAYALAGVRRDRRAARASRRPPGADELRYAVGRIVWTVPVVTRCGVARVLPRPRDQGRPVRHGPLVGLTRPGGWVKYGDYQPESIRENIRRRVRARPAVVRAVRELRGRRRHAQPRALALVQLAHGRGDRGAPGADHAAADGARVRVVTRRRRRARDVERARPRARRPTVERMLWGSRSPVPGVPRRHDADLGLRDSGGTSRRRAAGETGARRILARVPRSGSCRWRSARG